MLTVGNLSSVVLTSMDRWFVKALMTTLAFAQYSFAVSMENFMNVAVTPVTTTLYNYFCKATDKSQIQKTRNYVMVFAAAIVSCAFPARFILEIYLTKYIDSAKVMLSKINSFFIIITLSGKRDGPVVRLYPFLLKKGLVVFEKDPDI